MRYFIYLYIFLERIHVGCYFCCQFVLTFCLVLPSCQNDLMVMRLLPSRSTLPETTSRPYSFLLPGALLTWLSFQALNYIFPHHPTPYKSAIWVIKLVTHFFQLFIKRYWFQLHDFPGTFIFPIIPQDVCLEVSLLPELWLMVCMSFDITLHSPNLTNFTLCHMLDILVFVTWGSDKVMNLNTNTDYVLGFGSKTQL